MVQPLCSATGTVTLLSGQPKEGVSVEARSDSKGYYEETVTDSSGSYRLRGLLPDTTYLIKVVKKDDLSSSRIERASPESVSVKVSYILSMLIYSKRNVFFFHCSFSLSQYFSACLMQLLSLSLFFFLHLLHCFFLTFLHDILYWLLLVCKL